VTFPTSVIRRLARSEEMFARSQTYVAATVFVDGAVDEDAMSAAFDALVAAHPVLAGHLELGPDGLHSFVVDDFPHPGIWVGDGRKRLNQTAALANLRLNATDSGAEVTLYVHHSLADGQHQFELHRELFEYYRDVVITGRTADVSPAPAPESLENLLADRGITKQDRSGLERLMAVVFAYDLPPSVRATAGGDPRSPAAVPVARCRLTESETEALAEFCRDHRLSLHSVVSSAILLAEWQFRNTPDIPIPYLYPVDLRNLLTPPVSATASTNPLGVAAYLATITSDTEFADIARDIVDTFRADLADGLVQQSLLHFDLEYAGSPPGMPDHVMATDGGALPGLPTPPGMTATGMQSEFFTASLAGIDLYTFATVFGRLQIERHCHAPAPEVTMAAIHSLLSSIATEDDDWMSE
jgi:hypothetical protein